MPLPLTITPAKIGKHATGEQWRADDLDHLAKLVAIIMLGQSRCAHDIIGMLSPVSPAFVHADLVRCAKEHLTVKKKKDVSGFGYPRYQRDGLIFEIISWIAVSQTASKRHFLKDPHLRATMQGLDGLMIELAEDNSNVEKATFSEDKCVSNPKKTFSGKVLPAFLELQSNKRANEIVASATDLISRAGLDAKAATKAAAKILNKELRVYRSTFAVPESQLHEKKHKETFKKYRDLKNLDKQQRSGAQFLIGADLRDWFDDFALRVIIALEGFRETEGV